MAMEITRKPTIIGVSGYGYSGSGAVIDLFKEYNGIHVSDDFEFTLAYIPDGILDLEFHLCHNCSRFFSGDVAIRRFLDYIKAECRSPKGYYKSATNGKFGELSRNYIDKICQLSWKGEWMHDRYLCDEFERTFKYRILKKVLKSSTLYDRVFLHDMYLCVKPENFLYETRNYINKVIIAMKQISGMPIVLNQPFPANNPEPAMKFFEGSKAIIVDKDPRDMYLLLKNVSHSKWVPTTRVEDFVEYYKRLHMETLFNVNILYVCFEDLVYQYEKTVDKIEKFSGIPSENHILPLTNFIPSVSRNNTQLFRKYKNCVSDIEYIENNLPEFLYDFSTYPSITKFGKSF